MYLLTASNKHLSVTSIVVAVFSRFFVCVFVPSPNFLSNCETTARASVANKDSKITSATKKNFKVHVQATHTVHCLKNQACTVLMTKIASCTLFAHVPSINSPMVIVCVYETVLNCLHVVTPTPQALPQSRTIPSVNITAVFSVLKPLKRREREIERND